MTTKRNVRSRRRRGTRTGHFVSIVVVVAAAVVFIIILLVAMVKAYPKP